MKKSGSTTRTHKRISRARGSHKKRSFLHDSRGFIAEKKKWVLYTVAALVLVVGGYTGYTYYMRHKLKAHAAGYTYGYTNVPGIAWMRACKTYVPLYGGVYNVRFEVYRYGTNVSKITAEVQRGPNDDSKFTSSSAWGYGVLATTTASVSAYYGEKVALYANYYGSQVVWLKVNNTALLNPAWLANC